MIDHRGPEFAKLTKKALEGIKTIFKTTSPVVIYTATGTGAWEGALVNTLSPGDRVLMVETGQFATLWKKMAERLGLKPEFITTDWRQGIDPKAVEAKLREDKKKEIKAVCVLHNETSTGALTPIAEIRKAIDAAGHPALFMVDTISSLASADYRHDEWGVDVSVGGAQKGLMMPPGMSFNAISDKALKASQTSAMPKSFFAWDDMLNMNKIGFFPYTPATQMLHGLNVGIEMLHEEGLDNVFARHNRLAEATRRAVKAWGLENLNKNASQYSPTITAILLPEGHDADKFRALALDTFNIAYGARASAPMRASISASAISATSTTAPWSARSASPRWRWGWLASRTRRAARRRRSTTSSPRMRARSAPRRSRSADATIRRHGRACPGHPRLFCLVYMQERRGCPAQGRA